jgi:hypothetical protein
MDVAVTADAEAFHYSPQKMREYLAAVARWSPRSWPSRTVTDHVGALLYDAGDMAAFTDRLSSCATTTNLAS